MMRLLMMLLWFAIIGAVGARVVMRTDMPFIAMLCIWAAAAFTLLDGLLILRTGRKRR